MNLKQELQNMVNELKLEEKRKYNLAREEAMLSFPTVLEDLTLKIKKEASLGKWWYDFHFYENESPNTLVIIEDIANHFKNLGVKSYGSISYYCKNTRRVYKILTIDWSEDIKVNWFWKLLGC